MCQAIDNQKKATVDPSDGDFPEIVHLVHSGSRGRPRKEIDPEFLRMFSSVQGPQGISKSLQNVSACTVRRRLLEQQLAQPGSPVFTYQTLSDGTVSATRNQTTSNSKQCNCTAEELEEMVVCKWLLYHKSLRSY